MRNLDQALRMFAATDDGGGDTGNKPSLIVTGASGFIGRYFLESAKDHFRIYAIARRSRTEASVPYHPNIHWVQADLGNSKSVEDTTEYIAGAGGADLCLHLAAFYDFSGKDNEEYDRTNVGGTQNVLEMSRRLNVKRFIFASSVAACPFDREGIPVTEKSPASARYPYARSKRLGEAMTKSYAEHFPCSVVRLAAVFSDWCDYAPLYNFLGTWLSKRYDARILSGRGQSAVPYIHVHDVIALFCLIFRDTAKLPNFDTYIASPDGSTSHRDLFSVATHYFFGHSQSPIYLPRALIYIGIPLRRAMARIAMTERQPFERIWMITYIDRILSVDATYTREALGWEPTKRYHILRRLLLLLERMKSHPIEWHLRNEVAMKSITHRTNLLIYEQLLAIKETIVMQVADEIRAAASPSRYDRYRSMDDGDFQCYLSAIYHLLMAAVRSGDRGLMLDYIAEIALRRFAEGFQPDDIVSVLELFDSHLTDELAAKPELKRIRQEIYDYVGMTFQLAQDQVEDLYEELLERAPSGVAPSSPLLPDCQELQEMIRQLSAFYQVYPEERTRPGKKSHH